MRKIVVLGATQSGKTSLLRRYANNQFQSNEPPTIGLNVIMAADSETQMWDASGNARFHDLVFTSVSGADGIILCFNICNLGSFLELRDFWLPKLHERSSTPICLIGTHLDAAQENRQVTEHEVKVLRSAYGICHAGSCSAKTGQGMEIVQSFIDELPVRTARSVDNEEPSPRPLIDSPTRTRAMFPCCCLWLMGTEDISLE
jgi:small GTP-binding protein